MLSNGIALPSMPSLPSIGTLSSIGSFSSISLGLVTAVQVAGTALPVQAQPAGGSRQELRTRQDGGDPDVGEDGNENSGGGDVSGPAQVITACSVPGTAAITFDDGPYTWTEEISRMLKENNATATFFFNGQNYGCINNESPRVKAAFDAGHQVASHTWSHKDLATLSKEEIISEMTSVSQAIQKITGVTPAQMRPPYGSYNNLVVEAASQLGQDIITWNLDSGDSVGAPADQSKAEYTKAVQEKLPILALNHETHETTVKDVLPAAIKTLQDAGYRLVTVAECTGREPYMKAGAPPMPPSNLNC